MVGAAAPVSPGGARSRAHSLDIRRGVAASTRDRPVFVGVGEEMPLGRTPGKLRIRARRSQM